MIQRARSEYVDVTVVIPCYRCSATLPRALESVFAQSRVPNEIIVVDDGSDDGSAQLARDLQGRFGIEEIRVLALDANRGPASARNAGWNAARSELVAFLDADDAWHPRKLEVQSAFMAAHPALAFSGHAIFVDEHARGFDVLPTSWSTQTLSPVRFLLSNRLSTPTVMLKRKLPIRFVEGKRHAEDFHLWLNLLLSNHRGARIELPLACTFKPYVGSAGLSADLWRMELGELDTYKRLAGERLLPRWALPMLMVFSLFKFAVRVAKVMLRSHRPAGSSGGIS